MASKRSDPLLPQLFCQSRGSPRSRLGAKGGQMSSEGSPCELADQVTCTLASTMLRRLHTHQHQLLALPLEQPRCCRLLGPTTSCCRGRPTSPHTGWPVILYRGQVAKLHHLPRSHSPFGACDGADAVACHSKPFLCLQPPPRHARLTILVSWRDPC